MKMPPTPRVIALFTALLLGTTTAFAQSWTGAVSDEWSDGGNWSGGAAPSGTHVYLDILAGRPYPVISSTDNITANTFIVGYNGPAAL